MKDRYDVIVVGAGPAGSITAMYAARGGCSVLLMEKDRDIGMPVRCGEAVGRDGLNGVIEIRPRWIAATINRFRLVAPDGTVVEPDIGGTGYVLERRVFDYDLAMAAVEAGADVVTKAYVNGLWKESMNGRERIVGVTYTWKGVPRKVRGTVIVGADGVESRLGKWAGIDTTTDFRDMECCAQMTLAGVHMENDVCEFHFGSRWAPQGYLWMFPKRHGMVNVGVGISGMAARTRKPLYILEEFIKERFPQAGVLTTVAGGVPCVDTLREIVKDNVVLVGDAARQVNPVSGGGIAGAMQAGKIAGEVIARAVAAGDMAELEDYPRRWEKLRGARNRTYYKMKKAVFNLSDETLNSIAASVLKLPREKQTIWGVFRTALVKRPSLILEMAGTFGLK